MRKIIADTHEPSLARAMDALWELNQNSQPYWETTRTYFTLPHNVEIFTLGNLQAVDREFEPVNMNVLVPIDFTPLQSNHSFRILLADRFNLMSKMPARYLTLDAELNQTQEAVGTAPEPHGHQP